MEWWSWALVGFNAYLVVLAAVVVVMRSVFRPRRDLGDESFGRPGRGV